MVSIALLKDKYNKLIENPKEDFIKQVDYIYKEFDRTNKDISKPLLVYGSNNRNACVYALGVNYSLKIGKALDYVIVSAPHFINQHFLSEEHRDMELYHKMYYTDLLVLTLSQFDYKNQYLESMLIDLVETRYSEGRATIVYFDTGGVGGYKNSTLAVNQYLQKKQEPLDIVKVLQADSFSKPNTSKSSKTKEKTTKGGVRFF